MSARCFEARVAGVVHPTPPSAFVDLLRAARSPLDARALKLRLMELGHDKVATDAAWRRTQPVLRRRSRGIRPGARHIRLARAARSRPCPRRSAPWTSCSPPA